MMKIYKFEICENPTLHQGGWERMGEGNNYIQYASPSNPTYSQRVCTLDYVPQNHPTQITITGIPSISGKELEISVVVLRSDNYIIESLSWQENGYMFNLGSTYDKLGIMFRFKDGSAITPNKVRFDVIGGWREIKGYQYKAGENLFDAATNNVTAGKYITLDGTIGTDPNFSYTDYIPVEANKIYKRTWTGPALVQNAGASVAWYDSTKTFIERSASTQYPAGTTRIVDNFTAPANAAYAILNFPSKTWPNANVSLEFYDPEVKWREATAHKYSSGSWD